MTSPYLDRPRRSLEEAKRDRTQRQRRVAARRTAPPDRRDMKPSMLNYAREILAVAALVFVVALGSVYVADQNNEAAIAAEEADALMEIAPASGPGTQ